MDPALRTRLIDWLDVDEVQVYDVEGLLDLGDLLQIAGVKDRPDLSWPTWNPGRRRSGRGEPDPSTRTEDELDMFADDAGRRRARALPVPVVHGLSVERFVSQAVDDPNVLAIKMTVYRTSDDSALVPSLIAAAEKGKQAVCMVELKARFDERRNIHWSRALEEAGAHVVHGIPGLKTHAKAILDRPPRARRRPQLRDDRHRQLPRQERPAVRGLRASSPPTTSSARRSPTSSTR